MIRLLAARLLGCLIVLLAAPALVRAADPAPVALTPVRAPAAPIIDGTLDDTVWQGPELSTGVWGSYNPLHGEAIPQQTHVWIAYDDRYLYIAFRCDDPEAAKIKTSITRRDNIWSDDWVGLSLDALGTGQVAYHMMVNPSGVQLDMLQTNSGGEDPSPDWVWDSAGRVDGTGYTVEIRLPLQSIRFKGGDVARMGVLFWRRVSRTGYSVSWPQLKPNEWVFQHHAPLVFDHLRGRSTREAIPSVTYAGSEERATPSAWGAFDSTAAVGLSGKFGVTSTITVDATVNPDFSQVESDAFQVEVNQRFPVFFSEKRPFFMEGAGLFNLAGVGDGDGNMISSVHTRRIIDPIVGGKVTGSVGRTTFGVLTAVDQAAGRDLEAGDPLDGRNKVFSIGRAQMALPSPGSFAGAILSTTAQGPASNVVAGADLSLRKRGSSLQMTGMALYSSATAADGRHTEGLATLWTGGMSSRRYDASGQVEHYDRDFQMDSAFYNRTGFTSGSGFGALSFYPSSKSRFAFVKRVVPFMFWQGGQDRVQNGSDLLAVQGLRVHMARQGFFRVDYVGGHEPWVGERFQRGRWRASGNAQVFRWLRTGGNVNAGYATYYDEADPFQGRSNAVSAFATIQPNARLSQQVEWQRIDFNRADTRADVYDLVIVNSRTTYQFSRRLYARVIAQYDTSSHRLLFDALGSYELRPGTVFFAGYGALRERRAYDGGEWRTDELSPLRESRRGLFLKASYLYRF
ncbi:MAG: DUF5916 domain-containing protein [Vicinamibacteraceae bacterium]